MWFWRHYCFPKICSELLALTLAYLLKSDIGLGLLVEVWLVLLCLQNSGAIQRENKLNNNFCGFSNVSTGVKQEIEFNIFSKIGIGGAGVNFFSK